MGVREVTSDATNVTINGMGLSIGERIVTQQMVTWLAQKTSRAMPTHLVCSLLQIFMRDSLMLK